MNIALAQDTFFLVFHGLIKIPLKVKTESKYQGKFSEVKFARKENILLLDTGDPEMLPCVTTWSLLERGVFRTE